MTRYASKTEVSTDRSRVEIERILKRYGATAFGYMWEGTRARIGFAANGRRLRFDLPLPDRKQFLMSPSGRARGEAAVAAAWEQACRQAWRALALVIKAKLEAVEAGIVAFEAEFLAHILLPDDTTVGPWARPQIEAAYQSGETPRRLGRPDA